MLGKRQITAIALSFVIALFLGSTAWGIVNNYSAVPFWDMWNGYLGFYYEAKEIGWASWWELHNEHRLVLAKLFFWLDLEWFDGTLVFLFVFNFLFSGFACLTLFFLYKNIFFERGKSGPSLLQVAVMLSMLCFSWAQHANYLWAFQSQFHMAYLLPLLAFVAFSAAVEKQSWPYFILAAVLGVLSVGTMANGLLVLPLLVVMSAFLRQGWQKTGVLTLLAGVCFYTYFQGYSSPHGLSMTEGARYHFYNSLIYFFKYLAGPLNYSLKSNDMAVAASGVLIALLTVFLFIWFVRQPDKSRQYLYALALFAFLIFVAGTALSTAFSRAQLSMAMQARYMTPALLGWSSLALLLFYYFHKTKVPRWWYSVVIVLALILLLPIQKKSLRQGERVFDFKLAAVAAALKVPDEQVIGKVYFNPPYLYKVVEQARAEHKSIFTQGYIQRIPQVGGVYNLLSDNQCTGQLEHSIELPKLEGVVRVQGWLHAGSGASAPETLVLMQKNTVVGYAVSGQRRKDRPANAQAPITGFQGYLLATALEQKPLTAFVYASSGRLLCWSSL